LDWRGGSYLPWRIKERSKKGEKQKKKNPDERGRTKGNGRSKDFCIHPKKGVYHLLSKKGEGVLRYKRAIQLREGKRITYTQDRV